MLFKRKKVEGILFDEKDLTKVMLALDSLRATGAKMNKYGIRIGNCGWADEPTKWFLIPGKNKDFYKIKCTLLQYGVELQPEEAER